MLIDKGSVQSASSASSSTPVDFLKSEVMTPAQEAFHNKVLELSTRYTAKETARAFLVSTHFMRDYGELKGIVFATQESRTPEQSRRLRKELDGLKEEARIRRLKPILPSPGLNGLVLSPVLEKLSRKAMLDGQNKFVAMIADLAKTRSLNEVHRETKINLRQLRKIAYDYDIVFADQVVVFDEVSANAELIASARKAFKDFGLPANARRRLADFLLPATRLVH